ncbi:apoptosis-associated speck-like protein containing a CARD [Nematolebias whitei]|uniref:apoptosis-associated speck-like protein containing a CARD n=1 Tax=Nematolebias whitei TaxID=451745 RepID=UPI00189A0DDA|nr:apoptosis-associated speck-like protein containing a CARD [Nematolebias whitei]
MAPQTPKRLLSNVLEDLTKSDMEKFRHELQDRRSGTRRVRRNQLEGKSILEVSDVMIQVFTEKEALKMAVDILRDIGCCQDADVLAEQIRLNSSSDEGSANAASSDAEHCYKEMHIRLFKYIYIFYVFSEEHFVDKHRDQLIQRVSNVSAILDQLLKEKVITDEIYDDIRSKPTSVAKMREIYTGPMKGGKCCKDVLYKILKNLEPFLIADLEGN